MTELKDPRQALGEALIEMAEKNAKVVALSADSYGGSGLKPFKEKFPEKLIEFGIMEQCIIGFASGLATTGKIPFVVAITPFVPSTQTIVTFQTRVPQVDSSLQSSSRRARTDRRYTE